MQDGRCAANTRPPTDKRNLRRRQRSRRRFTSSRSSGEVRRVASWPSTRALSSGRRISSSWTTCPWRNSCPTSNSGKPFPLHLFLESCHLVMFQGKLGTFFILPVPEMCVGDIGVSSGATCCSYVWSSLNSSLNI